MTNLHWYGKLDTDAFRGRGAAAGPRGQRGGGFGLLAMAEQVEHLGGQLAVRSQPGEGTMVQVWLPVEAQEEGTL